MMMELFNDYGTFTYKILQNKNKKILQKTKQQIWAHNLQNFHDAGKLCTLHTRLPYISIGLHAEKQILTNPKNMVALTRMLLKDDIFFP